MKRVSGQTKTSILERGDLSLWIYLDAIKCKPTKEGNCNSTLVVLVPSTFLAMLFLQGRWSPLSETLVKQACVQGKSFPCPSILELCPISSFSSSNIFGWQLLMLASIPSTQTPGQPPGEFLKTSAPPMCSACLISGHPTIMAVLVGITPVTPGLPPPESPPAGHEATKQVGHHWLSHDAHYVSAVSQC